MRSKILEDLNKNNFEKICELLSNGFHNDPLYKSLIPNDEKRQKVLPILFRGYIKSLVNYATILVTSDDFEGVAIIYEKENYNRLNEVFNLSLYFRKNISVLKYISLKDYLKVCSKIRELDEVLKAKLKDIDKNYIHLELIVVDESFRRKGFGKQLVRDVIEISNSKGLSCTLKTSNRNNTDFYTGLGFKMIDTSILYNDLENYNMAYELSYQNKEIIY